MIPLIQIKSSYDVPGYQRIRTQEGIAFLDTLIQHHPLTIIEILAKGGYDRLITFAQEAEQKYHKVINVDPNDIDVAFDAQYGLFKYNSELDQEIEDLENEIYLKQQKSFQLDEFDDYFSDQELEFLPEDTLLDLYDLRVDAQQKKLLDEKKHLQAILDKKIAFRESILIIPILTSDLFST